MITIKNNKVYLNNEDYRVVTHIYNAFNSMPKYCVDLLKLATTDDYQKREPNFSKIVINAPCCLDAACSFIMNAVNNDNQFEIIE